MKALAMLLVAATRAFAADDGKLAFEKRCGGCHTADVAKEGPALGGIYGRVAGKKIGFDYSVALKSATFRWNAAALDRWLRDPEQVVPGTDMAFRLSDQAERALIVRYLRTLK